jgi:hypothetical protein
MLLSARIFIAGDNSSEELKLKKRNLFGFSSSGVGGVYESRMLYGPGNTV